MRKFSIGDVIISLIAIAVICAAIVPAVARLQRTPEDARCQSNLRRLAVAMQQYTNDWDGCYPANRMKLNMISVSQALLSPYDAVNNTRFVYSINWVEGLYDYIEAATKRTTPGSVWRCPMASQTAYPVSSLTARVSYAFNYNLLEQPTAFSRNRAKLMVLREMDRMVESVCRPVNNSTNDGSRVPMSPFLTEHDYMMRGVAINANLHTQGSYILFADGHVGYFGQEYFPETLSSTTNWDPETSQWWNWVNKDTGVNKAIAITP